MTIYLYSLSLRKVFSRWPANEFGQLEKRLAAISASRHRSPSPQREYYTRLPPTDRSEMNEIAFARQFLTALDSRPIKLPSDHVADPRGFPAQGAVRRAKMHIHRAALLIRVVYPPQDTKSNCKTEAGIYIYRSWRRTVRSSDNSCSQESQITLIIPPTREPDGNHQYI